ncbi:MAG: (d)CMP kinase [Candidatus Cryosericum sp.]
MRHDIAIDGPSGSGKTTVGISVAACLGLVFIDSGLLYRVFTAAYVAEYPEDVSVRAEHLGVVATGAVSYEIDGKVLFDERELQMSLHDPRVDSMVSPISTVPDVRVAVNRELRRIAALKDVVMVGRDIGTTVLPRAFLKVFITAGPDVRAARRTAQLARQGIVADYCDVLANIKERDAIDSSRADSPLQCNGTYMKVDNSTEGSDEVVQAILAEYRRRLERAI